MARDSRVCASRNSSTSPVALLGLQDLLADARPHADPGIARILGGQRAQQLLAMAPRLGRDDLLDLGLHRVASLQPELGRELLGQRLRALLERPAELAIELAKPGLELTAHVVHVDGGLLAIEDPGADLDRLGDGVGGSSARLGTATHHARRPLVRDRQPLDHETVRQDADAGVVEAELWFLGCFHRTHEGSRGVRRKPDGKLGCGPFPESIRAPKGGPWQ